MKKLAKLANILDQVKKYHTADKIDSILKKATSIKGVSPGDTHLDINRGKKENPSGKNKERKEEVSFEELLRQMSQEVSDADQDKNSTAENNSSINMETLIDMIKP